MGTSVVKQRHASRASSGGIHDGPAPLAPTPRMFTPKLLSYVPAGNTMGNRIALRVHLIDFTEEEAHVVAWEYADLGKVGPPRLVVWDDRLWLLRLANGLDVIYDETRPFALPPFVPVVEKPYESRSVMEMYDALGQTPIF